MNEQGSHSRQQQTRIAPPGARSSPGLPQQRRFDESWVEVASQPSSSSLSSIGDEIITTGLQVREPNRRRRRMPASAISLPPQQTAIYAADTSSQGDYIDSESEDDRLLSSSAENMRSSPENLNESDADSDDADNATALGRLPDRGVFQPQPNAFSHPPTLHQRSYSANQAMSPAHPHGDFTRPSLTQRSQTRVSAGSGPSFMSPTSREDNDEALRASLTTLLSCAAAARGRPKPEGVMAAQQATRGSVRPGNQPMDLCLVQESELMEDDAARTRTAADPSRTRRTPSSQSPKPAGTEKPRRSVSAGRSTKPSKRKKVAAVSEEARISPTMLTWVVSAGVVVLVSVVGFGAGYVIGREVGRQENIAAGVSGVNESSSCGREAIRSTGGLRRFKWTGVGKSIVA